MLVMDPKLLDLLKVVIENYISRWDPVGSKFLNSLESMNYAPSTLRKYLNSLESEWFLYQPYHSAWRMPTIKGFSSYIDDLLDNSPKEDLSIDFDFNSKLARNSLRFIIESLWSSVDWAVVWFLRNDEYYFLWINNLLSSDTIKDYETVRQIVKFIEDKKIVQHLNEKMIKQNQVKYNFIKTQGKILSCMYVKINVSWYDWLISILWPVRVNYKKNMSVLNKFLKIYNK